MNAETEVGVEAVRKLAEFEASAAVEARGRLIDEHNSAFRWMIASLFALNGGAILTIFGSGNIGSQPAFPAFWVFFAGVVSTFSAVVFAQQADRAMIAGMHSWGLYWTTVGITSSRDEKQEASIKSAIARAERFGRFGRAQALFAMVFFALGILTAVVSAQKDKIDRIEAQMSRNEAVLKRSETTLERLRSRQSDR